jgi:hypothetical protein
MYEQCYVGFSRTMPLKILIEVSLILLTVSFISCSCVPDLDKEAKSVPNEAELEIAKRHLQAFNAAKDKYRKIERNNVGVRDVANTVFKEIQRVDRHDYRLDHYHFREYSIQGVCYGNSA